MKYDMILNVFVDIIFSPEVMLICSQFLINVGAYTTLKHY